MGNVDRCLDFDDTNYLRKARTKCVQKRVHQDRDSAEKHAARLRSIKPKSHGHTVVYECPICHLFHVGRRPSKILPSKEDEGLRIAIGNRAYFCGLQENHWEEKRRTEYLMKIIRKVNK